MSTCSILTKQFYSRVLKPEAPGEAGVTARHEGVPGFSQAKLHKGRVFLIGAGGINSWIGLGLVRKGVGTLSICDGDLVELSNLSRQLFKPYDVHNNKGLALAQNLASHGVCGTRVHGYAHMFEELLHVDALPRANIFVVGVDDPVTRLTVMQHCLASNQKTVFIAVSEEADNGYVFVYVPGEACLACALPDAAASECAERQPCPGVPACLDVLFVVGGLALLAIDSLLMDRPRTWNFRRIFLSGQGEDSAWNVQRRPDCPICGEASRGC